MPQPECDDRAVDAVLKEFHRCGMAKHMGCHRFLFEGGAAPYGGLAVTGN